MERQGDILRHPPSGVLTLTLRLCKTHPHPGSCTNAVSFSGILAEGGREGGVARAYVGPLPHSPGKPPLLATQSQPRNLTFRLKLES